MDSIICLHEILCNMGKIFTILEALGINIEFWFQCICDQVYKLLTQMMCFLWSQCILCL